MQLWGDLLLKYCKCYKVYVISIDNIDEPPIFNNDKINRKLNPEARRVILEYLHSRGNVEWYGDKACLILWYTVRIIIKRYIILGRIIQGLGLNFHYYMV